MKTIKVDYATIYTACPSLLGSKMIGMFPEIISHKAKSNENNATGMIWETKSGILELNFIWKNELKENLKGFKIFAVNSIVDDNRKKYILSRIINTEMAIGIVIQNGFDKNNLVTNLLLDINNRLNGLLFLYDSIIDYNGEPYCGPMMKEIKQNKF
jgi:hypothetical protein